MRAINVLDTLVNNNIHVKALSSGFNGCHFFKDLIRSGKVYCRSPNAIDKKKLRKVNVLFTNSHGSIYIAMDGGVTTVIKNVRNYVKTDRSCDIWLLCDDNYTVEDFIEECRQNACN